MFTSVPKDIELQGKTYKPDKQALDSWIKVGSLNMTKLVVDGKIELEDTAVPDRWFKEKIFGSDAVFTGQVNKDNLPNGFVRVFLGDGSMYEGLMDNNFKLEGFGRYIWKDGDQRIGWLKNYQAHGNS